MSEWEMDSYFGLKASGIQPGPRNPGWMLVGKMGVEESLLAETAILPGLH